MRRLTLLLLPALLDACVLSHGGGDERPKSVDAVLLNGLAVFNGTTRGRPGAALDELRDVRAQATGKEKAEVDRLLPILERFVEAPQSVTTADYQEVEALMDQVAAAHPDDFEVQLQMANGIYNTETAAHGRAGHPDSGGDGLEAGQALRRSRSLASRFPNEARAHAHLGQVLAATGGDTLQAMRSFARCLTLDAGAFNCRSSFDALADEYRRPRCTRFKPEGFGLHQAYDKAGAKGKKGLKPFDHDGQRLAYEPKPVLTGKDINELTEEGTPAAPEYTVYLTPTAAARFSELTARLAAAQGYLAIVVGGKVRSAPRVMSEVDSGLVRISGAKLDIGTMCSKFEHRPLPADLTSALKR